MRFKLIGSSNFHFYLKGTFPFSLITLTIMTSPEHKDKQIFLDFSFF